MAFFCPKIKFYDSKMIANKGDIGDMEKMIPVNLDKGNLNTPVDGAGLANPTKPRVTAVTTIKTKKEFSEESDLWQATVFLAFSMVIMTNEMRRDAERACFKTHVMILDLVQFATFLCVAFIAYGLWRITSVKKTQAAQNRSPVVNVV